MPGQVLKPEFSPLYRAQYSTLLCDRSCAAYPRNRLLCGFFVEDEPLVFERKAREGELIDWLGGAMGWRASGPKDIGRRPTLWHPYP